MRNLLVFDDDVRGHLLPLCYTRPVAELRLGILTIKEKWERWLDGKASYITQDYLASKYTMQVEAENWVVNASILPDAELCNQISSLSKNEALLTPDGKLIATLLDAKALDDLIHERDIDQIKGYEIDTEALTQITQLADLTRLNQEQLRSDFEIITRGRKSQPIPSHVQVRGRSQIFIEENCSIGFCTLNASDGPIYIGHNVQIQDGAIIQGNCSIGEHSKVKMAARISGPTTIGPVCTAGGEISRSIMIGYSNKGHDGFLGDSILGEWCNLGADTNNSNLKNNYAEVKLWNYVSDRFEKTGQQFVGLIMGDHSKCGINTMFNTGTVVGVSSNLFGAGYHRNFVPSFTWGGPQGMKSYGFERAIEVAKIVMARRHQELHQLDRSILQHVLELSSKYRPWEKNS